MVPLDGFHHCRSQHIMAIPASWQNSLTVPAIAAPMFLASNAALTLACCESGIIGTCPALNFRDNTAYEHYLHQIETREKFRRHKGQPCAPHGVNLSLRKGNPRLEEDLRTTIAHKVPLVITSLGLSRDVVERVHAYGGLIFHDVISLKFAEKAASAGADGLIAVAAGAGGHGGTLSPFAFVEELSTWFHGTLVLAGAITNGRQIAAARLLGADMVSIGTRFLATAESGVPDAYKAMVCASRAQDIIHTPHFTGVHANFLRPSLEEWGLDPDNLATADIDPASRTVRHANREGKVWRDIWSAGQGAGAITDIPTAAALCTRLAREYAETQTAAS
jgi:nitronate monooxygenase